MFKKIVLIIGLSLLALSGHANLLGDDVFEKADKAAQKQQADVAVEEVVPVPFDEAQAKSAMELGEATVKGVLYHRLKLRADYVGEPIGWTKDRERFIANADVMLFPVTAHLKEQRRLEIENKKQRLKSKTVQLKKYLADPRMFNYMLTTKTDTQGRFNFQQLKPGRYLVFAADQAVTLTGLERVKIGQSNVSYGVGAVHYEDRQYEIQRSLEYEAEIEVKSGQKEVKVNAQMNTPNLERGLRGLFN